VFKICVKFEQNRTIRCRVINDLAHYRREIFEGSRFHERISGVRVSNFTKLGDDIRSSSLLTEFVSELRYLAAFSNAGWSKSSYVENDAKFRHTFRHTSNSFTADLHVDRRSVLSLASVSGPEGVMSHRFSVVC